MLFYVLITLLQTEADMVSHTTNDPSRYDGVSSAMKSLAVSAQISLFTLIVFIIL